MTPKAKPEPRHASRRARAGLALAAALLALLLAGGAGAQTNTVEVELTESAVNNTLASLTQVRGINFGEYLAGFVDAWWINLDSASFDVRPPSGSTNRVRVTASATAKSVLDLFVVDVPLSAGASGWIEGNVTLSGNPTLGYKLLVDFTNLDINGWVSGVPSWLSNILFEIVEDELESLPPIELNLGTWIAPAMTCVVPDLVTNAARTALVLRWDVGDLTCLPAYGAPSSECVGVDYLRNTLGLPAATCAAYCASIGKTCSNTCTTNRGFPNWGVEAWVDEATCQAYSTSGGQVTCATNLASFSAPDRKKYRCCCV
jgi:hypothetical protein